MYLENRLIAMLDVLGFSSRIQDPESLQKTMAQYAGLITAAQSHMFSPEGVPGSPNTPPSNFEFGQFVFDTLVLVSHPLDVHSVAHFVLTTSLLMEKFFEAGFPLRGAIGKGNFCMDNNTRIFLSDAFKRLKAEEDNQQWTGCTLLPEIEEQVIEALLGEILTNALAISAPIHRVPVPCKQKTIPPTERWCVNWSHFLAPATIIQGMDYLKGDTGKHQGTAEYLEYIRTLPNDTSRLSLEFAPAVAMKFIKTRASVRIRFEDSEGNGVKPGCDSWTCSFGYPSQ